MKTIINFANKVRSLVDGRMSNIANVEESPSTRAYAVGKQLIFNGLLCKATSAISVGDTLAVGTNLALADNVVEQIYSLNQGLSNRYTKSESDDLYIGLESTLSSRTHLGYSVNNHATYFEAYVKDSQEASAIAFKGSDNWADLRYTSNGGTNWVSSSLITTLRVGQSLGLYEGTWMELRPKGTYVEVILFLICPRMRDSYTASGVFRDGCGVSPLGKSNIALSASDFSDISCTPGEGCFRVVAKCYNSNLISNISSDTIGQSYIRFNVTRVS
jgi:hypothetical protein